MADESVQLPAGYDDAKAVAVSPEVLKLPSGYEDAKAVPPASADLSGPGHVAQRRLARAQPGITPADRAASPINQNIMTGLRYTPMVASLALGGAEAAPAISEAMGARSLAPLTRYAVPAIKGITRGYLGAEGGGYLGRRAGALIGEPEMGETAGKFLGGLYGSMGGKIPRPSAVLDWILGQEEHGVPPIPAEAMPTRTPSVGGETLSPQKAIEVGGGKFVGIQKMYGTRPDVALFQTGEGGTTVSLPAEGITPEAVKAKISSLKPTPNAQFAKNIESGVRQAAGTPQLRSGVSLRMQPTNTVGAKTVTSEPFTETTGPRIDTASKNVTTGKVIGEQVEAGAGGKPTPSVTRGFDEKGNPVQVSASERNKGTFYENRTDIGPKERQDIHTNLEVDRVPVPNAEQHWEALKDKPEVRDDLFAMQNDQVREALRKSGIEDLGNKTVKGSDMVSTRRGGPKFRDPDIIPRATAIGKMLDAGIPPEDIVKWGGGAETRTKVAPERFKFAPERLETPLKVKP